jgi:BASS family bile acid:Na+ symporter
MVGIGSSISFKEIHKIFQKPKKIIWGLVAQVILFPVLAFLIAIIANIPTPYKVGLVILAACPGGTLSNFISYLIKADTPLSVGLTSTNSIITLFTIPLYAKLSIWYFVKDSVSVALPLSKMILEIFSVTIIPLAIGLLIHRLNKKVTRYENHLKIASSILLAVVFIMKFLSSSQDSSFTSNFSGLLVWAILLNISGIFLGWFIGGANKFSRKTKTTLGIEIGLQNTVLALLVTDVLLKNPMMGEPALIYAMFSFWVTLGLAMLLKGRTKVSSIEKQIENLD